MKKLILIMCFGFSMQAKTQFRTISNHNDYQKFIDTLKVITFKYFSFIDIDSRKDSTCNSHVLHLWVTDSLSTFGSVDTVVRSAGLALISSLYYKVIKEYPQFISANLYMVQPTQTIKCRYMLTGNSVIYYDERRKRHFGVGIPQ